MRFLILSSLAAAALATASQAQEESTDEWADLDSELSSMEGLSAEVMPGPHIWGYARSNFAYSTHSVGNGGEKLRGFSLDNIRVNVSGETAGYEYRITGELQSGTMTLEDAWASTALGEEIRATLGRFRTPFLRSGTVEARDLLFISRTRNGVFYSVRDQGAMLNGDHGRLHWAAALQNGADSTGEKWLSSLNLRINLMGLDELPWEGAFNAGPETRLSAGVAVADDGAVSDGTAFVLDAYLIHRGFSFQAEWLDYGDDYSLATGGPFLNQQVGGTQPWSATASYMVVPDEYELAVRYDDYDDKQAPLDFDRSQLTFGLNRYIQGHDLKWQLNYAIANNKGADAGPHYDILALGLTIGF
jgi:hypothetical protein